MANRRPAVAGQFYEGAGDALAREIERCFLDPRGPGELPPRHRSGERHVRALVVPHAGYPYSGAIAARGFATLAGERPPRHVLVLGVDHHGLARGPSLSARAWDTPLGPVRSDPALVSLLSIPPMEIDEAAHRLEHSIEVELPFLQYVLPAPTFVPLMVPYGPLTELRRTASAIRTAIAGRDVLLVASTDFSHYVSPAEADRLDHVALEKIGAGDADGLYSVVRDLEISMCGIAPTTVLLAVLEGEPLERELLRWGHSGEVATMADVVGYASVAFRSAAELG